MRLTTFLITRCTATLLLFILCFSACRKADKAPQDPSTSNQEYTQLRKQFFNASAADPEVQKLAANLQKGDSLFKFLPAFVRKNGIPKWEKTLYKIKSSVRPSGRSMQRSAIDSGGQGLFFVPLQSQNSTQVQAYIAAYKTGDSTYSYKLFNKDSLVAAAPQTGETKRATVNALGVLAYFEKAINNQQTSQYALSSTESVQFNNPNITISDTAAAVGGRLGSGSSISRTFDCNFSLTVTETYTEINIYVNGQLVYHYESYSVSVVMVISGDCGGGGGGGGYDPWGNSGGNGWYNWGTGYNYDPFWANYNYNGWLYPWWMYFGGGGGPVGPNPNAVRSGEYDPTVTDFDPDIYWWDDNTTSFPPQMLPSWNDMNNNYPKKADGTEMCGTDVYNLVGGQVLANMPGGGNPNACALRVSRALNYSGVTIPDIPGQTFKGADNKNYFLSAAKLYNFMSKTFTVPPNPAGSVETYTGAQGGAAGANFPSLLAGKQGIYIMQVNYPGRFGATGHASIWNGASCVHNNCDGTDHDGAYFNADGGVNKIKLFKLN